MKASSIAHPIQGLIKYHGLRDPLRRIPYHDSISVCTGPTHTHTTVEAADRDVFSIDGVQTTGRGAERMTAVLDAVRAHANDPSPVRVESKNSFPQYVGLGSSSSGFAALAHAAAQAMQWDASLEQLSEVARLGAGSAARAVTGGVSDWVIDGERSYSKCILEPKDLDWRIVVPLVRHEEPTEGVHQEVVTSPLFDARLAYIEGALREAREACKVKDLHALWALAERDTLNLHAITMTGKSGHVTWQPATMAVIRQTRALRASNVPVWFSIDTGATAYLNTTKQAANDVASSVKDIDGVSEVLMLEPAGSAHSTAQHLF